MRAAVEILSGVVRVGPEYEGPGTPFEFAAAFSASEGVAEVKALVAPTKFTLAHFRAGKAALKALGLAVKWRRVEE